MPQQRQGDEVVLRIGAEGGSISIVRRFTSAGRWEYLASTDESTLWDMLEASEGDGGPAQGRTHDEGPEHDDARGVSTFDEAVRSIGRYPWPLLTPLEIHPDYRDGVLAAAHWHPASTPDALDRWMRECDRIAQRPPDTHHLSPWEAALRIAAVVHAHQVRKGTRLPYVSHVVSVSHLLEQAGQPEPVVLAGLLHDVLEDVHDDEEGRTRAALAATFDGFDAAAGTAGLRDALARLIDRLVSPEVRWLVQAVSETKDEGGVKRPWMVRKLEQFQHLADADPRVLALKAADTLHNAQAILHDSHTSEGRVFSRFNASVDDILWYYGATAATIGDRLGDGHALASDLQIAVRAMSREADRTLGRRDAFTGRRPQDPGDRTDTTVAVIGPRGARIHSVAEWQRLAPPARSHQWRAGRSAMESARAWFTGGSPEARVPSGIRALLDGHPSTRGAMICTVFPEHETRLDDFGRGRQHDVLACGMVGDNPLVLAIEAKADEPFGELIGRVAEPAVGERGSALQAAPSRRPERVAQLVELVVGRGLDDAISDLRYQLLHAVAGTLLEAKKRRASLACFVVQEFRSPACSADALERNARDLLAFARALGFDVPGEMPVGTLVGPRRFEWSGVAVDLLIGKVTVTLDE